MNYNIDKNLTVFTTTNETGLDHFFGSPKIGQFDFFFLKFLKK
jgi:hypothetical protein